MAEAILSTEHIQFVCALVKQRSAIDLDSNKAYLIEARLAPIAKKSGCQSIGELVNQVRDKKSLALESRIVEAMTTNETSFFRDVHPFDALRMHILPEIIRKNQDRKTLNIWSAACSTGQEIYSVALMLREYFPQLQNWKLRLVGTDLSTEVLAKARAASFTQIDVNRGLPATMLSKYFQKVGITWQLKPEISTMADFIQMNLIESWPTLPDMDIVFLRNVLIYFPIEIKRQILERVKKVMAPHAVLFLGAAETTLNLDVNFTRLQYGNAVCYRV